MSRGPRHHRWGPSAVRLRLGAVINQPTRADFERLLDFRVSPRTFAAGVRTRPRRQGSPLSTPASGRDQGPSRYPAADSCELADYLLQYHTSICGLVDRAEIAGLVERVIDTHDSRYVHVRLTEKGDRIITQMTIAHLVKLRSLAASLDELVAARPSGVRPSGHGGLQRLRRAPRTPRARGRQTATLRPR